jgi:cytochrome c oxidase subunit 2
MNDDASTFVAPPPHPGGSFWLPVQGSTKAPEVDSLFHFITGISLFFFVLIVGLIVWFLIQYRRRPGIEPQPSPHHNTVLELSWSILPSLLLVVMFYRGFTSYMDMRTPPDGAMEINVNAKKWSWLFTYSNGWGEPELHVPRDVPVTLVMTSEDVIHSLFIPAFRVKMDVVPGRYTKLWFNATEVGEFTLFCTEYCGTRHSDMLAKVVVHDSVAEYQQWLEKASDPYTDQDGQPRPLAEVGAMFYTKRGCIQCLSTDGSAKTGPTFKGTFGTTQKMTDGTDVVIDENYVRESILNPMAKVRGGFRPVMPTFQGQLKDQDIGAIIAYMKSLK